MPDSRIHRALSALSCGTVSAAWELRRQAQLPGRDHQRPVDLLSLVGWTALGAVVGATVARWPDMIEPPTCRHHRGFFHSQVLRHGLVAAAHWVVQSNWEGEAKFVALNLIVSWDSHLAADSTTPDGIPLVGIR
jgi:hypothetical protein